MPHSGGFSIYRPGNAMKNPVLWLYLIGSFCFAAGTLIQMFRKN